MATSTRDEPKVCPGVDASPVDGEQFIKDADGVAVKAGVVEVDRFDDGVAVLAVLVHPGQRRMPPCHRSAIRGQSGETPDRSQSVAGWAREADRGPGPADCVSARTVVSTTRWAR